VLEQVTHGWDGRRCFWISFEREVNFYLYLFNGMNWFINVMILRAECLTFRDKRAYVGGGYGHMSAQCYCESRDTVSSLPSVRISCLPLLLLAVPSLPPGLRCPSPCISSSLLVLILNYLSNLPSSAA